jgi:hopanoid biosynthesis associated RND transporter like protein HpnN
MLDRAIEAYRAALVWWVDTMRRLALAVLVTATTATAVASYYTLQNLGINTDTDAMLSPDLPFRRAWDEFTAAFPQLRNLLLVVIEGDNPDLTEDAAAALAARLAARPELFRTVYHPGGDRFFQANGMLFLDVEELVDLTDELAAAQPLIATLAQSPSLRGLVSVLVDVLEGVADGTTEVADVDLVFDSVRETLEAQLAGRHHFLSWKKLMRGGEVSREERRQFIILQPRLDYSRFQPAGQAIDFVRHSAAALDLDQAHGVRVRLTGSVALNHEELRSVSEGAGLAGLLSLLIVAALLVIGLRSTRLVLAALVALVYGLAWTAAFATAAVGHLNLMSIAFAVLFVGLGVDFGIHFGLRYREEIERGQPNDAALRLAAGGVGVALTLCAVMAAVGFYAFIPTSFKGVSELGLISGTGMFAALFASLTVMPAMLAVLPLRPRREAAVQAAGDQAAGWGERVLDRNARAIVLGALLLGGVGIVVATQTRFDFNPLNLKDPTTESVQTLLDLFAESDASPYTIGILAADPARAAALADRLAELPEVDRTVSLRDYVPRQQAEKLEIIGEAALFLTPVLAAKPPAEAPSAEQRRAEMDRLDAALDAFAQTPVAADYPGAGRLAVAVDAFRAEFATGDAALAELEQRLVATLGKRLEVLARSLSARPVTVDDLPDTLIGRQLAADGRARVEVYPAEDISDNDALRRFVTAVRALAPNATDSPIALLEAGDAVVDALEKAMVLAVILISLALVLALRSVLDAVLVLLPLALAGVLTLAATVLLPLPFNFANAIVLPLLLGLGVASGIHLVTRERDAGAGATVLRTSTPRAVLFSALTTIGSFGTLAVSSHRGTASMGELLTISIALTLACTLVVLPAMLSLLRRRRPRTSAAPARLAPGKTPVSAE